MGVLTRQLRPLAGHRLRDGTAMASVVLGMVSIFANGLVFVGVLFGVALVFEVLTVVLGALAVTCGVVSRRRARRDGTGGSRAAVAGAVLGAIGMAVTPVLIVTVLAVEGF